MKWKDIDYASIEKRMVEQFIYGDSTSPTPVGITTPTYLDMKKKHGVWQMKKEKKNENENENVYVVSVDIEVVDVTRPGDCVFAFVDECGSGSEAFTRTENHLRGTTGGDRRTAVRRAIARIIRADRRNRRR